MNKADRLNNYLEFGFKMKRKRREYKDERKAPNDLSERQIQFIRMHQAHEDWKRRNGK